MKRIRKIIDKNSTGKKVLFLFVLTNLVYAIMLIITIPKTMTFSNGMKLLDIMPTGYDSEYIISLFEALGDNGRQAYLYGQLPVDMIYPFLFGITYCLMIGYFLKKISKLNSPFFYLCFLPVIAGIADYLENFGIIKMLNNYPELTETTVNVTNTFSVLKSTSTSIFFIALIVILIILGIKFVKRNKTSVSTM